MRSLRKAFTGEEDTETDYAKQVRVSTLSVKACAQRTTDHHQALDGFSCLSWKQKVIGFIVCILLSATFSIVVSVVIV